MVNASANNGSGGIVVTESDGLVIGSVDADTGNAVLTATAGSITDDGNAGTVITATDLVLTANAANATIGTSGDAIDTTLAGTLVASAIGAGTGGIFVTDATGPGKDSRVGCGRSYVMMASCLPAIPTD